MHSDDNVVKLENNNEKFEKFTMYKLHMLFLNNQWVKEEIKEEASNSLA